MKLIWQNPDGSIQGCNILWGWLKWGEFKVSSCTPYSHRFQYAHFHDSVFYHFHDDRSAGFPVRVIDSKDIADGYLYRKYKLRATFTMTRILPEKAA